jgi:drug/metabolite transporter (DMT)-like permease
MKTLKCAVTLFLVVVIACLIGSVYEDCLLFWKNATMYHSPKWSEMILNLLGIGFSGVLGSIGAAGIYTIWFYNFKITSRG